MQKFDFIVIGGGVAGLTYALEVCKHGAVAVLFKKSITDSSTSWAQGGIAAVSNSDDNSALHIQDTILAGAGINDPEIVKIVVEEGPERVAELIARGINFDKENDEYHLHREGGHSRRRIFHFADRTGYEIQRGLLAACKLEKNIKFFENTCAIDLLTSKKIGKKDNQIIGVYVLHTDRKIELFVANKILLATGGAGKVYLYTSNPDVASGDGIAMAYRAGVPVANMEFFQFHPTCLFHPKAKTFLLSEALRGEGAILKRVSGERFMKKYHPDGELAARDIVARAIDNEMKTSGDEYMLLDITHKSADFIKQHFPAIYSKCLEYGFDITKEAIPVVPAAHYLCGGVITDKFGSTEITGLYAAGEVAYTGLHGANRLASNSLLEGLVFGYRAAQHSIKSKFDSTNYKYPEWDSGKARDSDEEVIITQNWDEVRRLMWNYVGIVRSNKRLERADRRIDLILDEIDQYYWDFLLTADLIELRNIALVSKLIISSAIQRKESVGLHYNIDYPEQQALSAPTIVRKT